VAGDDNCRRKIEIARDWRTQLPLPSLLDQPAGRHSSRVRLRSGPNRPLDANSERITVRIDSLDDFPFIKILRAESFLSGGEGQIEEVFRTCQSDVARDSFTRPVYAIYLISGDMSYDGGECLATAGDLLIFAEIGGLTRIASTKLRALLLIFPPSERPDMIADRSAAIFHISRDRLLPPLAHCLSFISSRFSSAHRLEYEQLYTAVRSLLPVAMVRRDRQIDPFARSLSLRLLQYVDRELRNPALDPVSVASHFGISVRYVHKLFAQQGLTAGAYIKAKRLEQVRFDLIAPANRQEKIAVIAKKWGFHDLSTFTRAFREKYGCKPSEARFT
jgi:AraC-like DNA-binding protein